MPKLRRKPPRERLSPDLERITLPASSSHPFAFVFSGQFVVFCPRCQKPATIQTASIWLALSCGCYWHPPRKERGHDEEAWVSYQEGVA